MSGEEQFKKMGEKLKAEKAAHDAAEQKAMNEAKSELALLKENGLSAESSAEAAAFLKAEAKLDEDLGSDSLPLLCIHTSLSENNELMDGSQPKVGQLFHSGLRQAKDEWIVRILKIRQCELEKYGKPGEWQNNYIIAGVMATTNEPFVLYVKGLGYNEVWDLQGQLKQFSRTTPKYSLFVKLFTEMKEPLDKKYKAQPAVKFEVLTDENGKPYIENNLKVLQWLKNMVDQAADSLDSIIANKGRIKVKDADAEFDRKFDAVAHPEEVEVTDLTSQGDVSKAASDFEASMNNPTDDDNPL